MEEQKLNKAQRKAFLKQIDRFYNSLRRKDICCRKNYMCCGTCGHAELNGIGWLGYVFYHAQEAERLREGVNEVYFQHNIEEELVDTVMKISIKHNVEWKNGLMIMKYRN
jgi:hypothetical protein